jgi:hypothetical protein
MRISRSAVLLFFCSLLPASLTAQQPVAAPVASDPQAVLLLQQSLAAQTGGATISDVTLTGSAHSTIGSDDETGTAILTAKAPSYSKMILSLSSGLRTEIRNPSGTPLSGATPVNDGTATGPQSVGAWSGPDGVLHGIAVHNLMTDATWFFPALTLSRLASSPAYVLSYVGQEPHEGQMVMHVSIGTGLSPDSNSPLFITSLLQHLSHMDIYFDPATLLPVALAFSDHLDNNFAVDIAIEIRFSGYQAVNGVQVPYHVQKYDNNGLVLDLQLDNATLNSGLAATAFEIK